MLLMQEKTIIFESVFSLLAWKAACKYTKFDTP